MKIEFKVADIKYTLSLQIILQVRSSRTTTCVWNGAE